MILKVITHFIVYWYVRSDIHNQVDEPTVQNLYEKDKQQVSTIVVSLCNK